IRAIAHGLGLDVRPEVVDVVAEATSLESSRRTSQTVELLGLDRVAGEGRHMHDLETLIHPNHILDGSSGYGKKQLSSQQLDAIDAVMDECGFAGLVDPTS